MSYADGMAAMKLEMPARVPRTDYSAEGHWAQHRSIWNAVYDRKTPVVSILKVSDEKIQVKALCVADNAEGFEVYDRFELTK